MKNTFNKSALILAVGLIAGSSFATDKGSLTREKVRAEFAAARANGTLPPNGEGQMLTAKRSISTQTRKDVQADFSTARKAGTLTPNGEGQEARVVVVRSGVTRMAVKADYIAARKAGLVPKNDFFN